MKLHFFLFLFVTLCYNSAYSQGNSNYYRDQLIDNYESATSDLEKYINGTILAIDIQLNSKSKAKEYSKSIRNLNIDNDAAILLARAYNLYHSQAYGKSMEMLRNSLQDLEDLKSPTLLGQAYFLEGLLYFRNYSIKEAIKSYNKSERYFSTAQHRRGLADILSARGLMSFQAQRNINALNFYKQAKQLYSAIGAKDMVAIRCSNISRILLLKGENISAIESYKEALEYAEASNFKAGKFMRNITTKLANLYTQIEEYENAKLYKENLLQLQNVGNYNHSSLSIADYYTITGNQKSEALSSALASQWKSEKTSLELKNEKIKRELSDTKAKLWTAISLGALILLLLGGYNFKKVKTKNQLIEEQNIAIEKNLAEKEVLLREIHHRVKNNLQVVSSLLGIQGRGITDQKAKDAIQEGRNRVQSMSLIHQNLYKKENLTGIEMKPYIHKLSHHLLNTYQVAEGIISINTKVDDIILDVETVVPIGLIINELISNSLKYAFPDNGNGTINITLQEKENTLVLAVADDGIGLNPDQIQSKTDSFGHSLIRAFKSKLDAEIEISGEQGTSVSLIIKKYQKAT